MKKFFQEFKKFITRGNVIDMSVGVIVGSAFTAIVTSLTNKIFMPFVNWLLSLGSTNGKSGMEAAVTYLKVVETDGVIDMTKSIYIDWGAFITAILNFFIIALILFTVVKMINGLRDANKASFFGYTKEEYFTLRKQGNSKKQIKALAEQREAELAAKKAEEEAEAARKAAEPSSTDKLLMEILEALKNK